jgi:hypothetical protein|tara:strand:- start:197 stop:754 length:558 start_codon:yes stop_codon:yes gene_type:complete
MAVSKFIQAVKDEAKGRPRSTQWYRQKIAEFGKPGALDLIRDGKRSGSPFFGNLNMFFYDPKFKKTLPYYDTFPLVLPLGGIAGGFFGINFHYLPIPARLRLLENLKDFTSNSDFNESTVLNVNYSDLKNINLIKPTIHKYLSGYTKSQFRKIDPDEFIIAALLPVHRFKKGSENDVWRDSRRFI